MADVSVTAANVKFVSGGTQDGTAGESITAGQVVYLDATTQKFKLADDNLGALFVAEATVRGIALHAAALDQPLRIQTSGVINLGTTLTVGECYALSDNAGGVCPFSDKGAGDWIVILGIGLTAANLQLSIINSGIQHA